MNKSDKNENEYTKNIIAIGCQYCSDHINDDMMPPHIASDKCESGKHNHCTCDICF